VRDLALTGFHFLDRKGARRKDMRFDTIHYIEWFKKKPEVTIDLCSSGVIQLMRKDMDISWEDLEISGENFYGYPPLIEAIADRYGVKEKNVVSSIGTSHALFLVCAALIEAGDRVLIEAPTYEPLLAVSSAFGAQVSRLPRRFEEGYGISLPELESLLTQGIKFVLLTNLHNPSGSFLPRETLEKVIVLAKEKNILVVIDEIYLEFMFGEPSAFHLSDNVLIISSLTKVFGLGSLRCGWVLAPPELAQRMRRIVDYTNVEGTVIGEKIACQMFGQLDAIKRKTLTLIESNKNAIRNMVNRIPCLSWVEPAGGVVCFPRIQSGFTGDELAQILREDHDTAIVPGSFFECSRHFRLGYGGDPEVLAAGLTNIQKVLCEIPEG
jgi:aspartate/methionine/tyrosine aminotransferase